MKKKIIITLLFFACFITVSCSNSNNEISVSLQDAFVADYEIDTINNLKIRLDKCELSIPENSSVCAFYVYDDVIYYALSYSGLFEGAAEADSIIEFEDKYNTQIKSYNIKTGEGQILFSYHEDRCVNVTDLQCNGTELVWEDYNLGYSDWNIRLLDIKSGLTIETIATQKELNGDFSTVTLTITDENLYWYDMSDNEDMEHPIELWRYDFAEKKIYSDENMLDTASPYEHFNIVNGVQTTYEFTSEDISTICISEDTKETNIQVVGCVSNPISNGQICVWISGYDYSERNDIYIYDLMDKKLEKITGEYIFSFGIVENYLILNKENGLWIYDTENKKCECLLEGDSVMCGYTFQTFQGNVYMESYKNIDKEIIYSITSI